MYQYDIVQHLSPDDVLVYLRKSRADDPALTVEEVLRKHETILDDWSKSNLGCDVPEKNKYREVVSGETISDRPLIQELLKKIELPKYKAVLVVEVQRLSRGDLEDAGHLIKILRYTNTVVITPTKTYDLQNEFDRDAFERELKRGNEYLEYQKKIMNRGRLLSVSQGNYIGSVPPYGYDKVWVTDGKKKCPTLAENKEQADAVRLIFDLYVNKDMGFVNICHYLDNMGIKPLKGGFWSPAFVKNLLENVHYIGLVKWNHRKTVTVVENSEIMKTRPKSHDGEYLICEGKHKGIISEELFAEAQKKRGRNHRAKAKTKIRNPFASLIYCRCGRAMSLRTYKRNGTERSAPRLLCDDQVHCNTGSCLYQEMVSYVSDILKENIENFEILMKNSSRDSEKLHEHMIKNLENRMQQLQEKELAQWEAQSDPDPAQRMPAEVFKRLNEKLLKEKEEVRKSLENAYEAMPQPIDYNEKIVRFKAALEALENPLSSASEKNRLLKNCIERIEYYRMKPERSKKAAKPLNAAGWASAEIELDVKLRV